MIQFIRQKIGPAVVMLCAILFVAYHIVSVVLGMNSFTQAWQPTTEDNSTAQVESTDNSDDVLFINDDRSGDDAIQIGLNYVAAHWPTRVTMETVGVDLPLVGSMESQGAWDVSESEANFAINTAIPNGRSGNTVLFGHDRPKLFRDIHDLKVGDQITVHGADGQYIYVVDGFKVVKPSDVSVMEQSKSARLTLITCDGWLSQDRFIVTAQLLEVRPDDKVL